jgi:cell division GTPase FtsZ
MNDKQVIALMAASILAHRTNGTETAEESLREIEQAITDAEALFIATMEKLK